jgi:phosphoribosylformylglycinamidine synthase
MKCITQNGIGLHQTMTIIHYYRTTEPSHSLLPSIKEQLKALGLTEDADKIDAVETESCFNVLLARELDDDETKRLEWLFAETFDRNSLRLERSALRADGVLEFGPRMTFTSAFSSNCVSICVSCNLPVDRCEQSRRYRLVTSAPISGKAIDVIKAILHDRMTEEIYEKPITSFDSGAVALPVRSIPIMSEGRAALEQINKERGLGFDDFDLDYYTDLFKVRCFLTIYRYSILLVLIFGHRKS